MVAEFKNIISNNFIPRKVDNKKGKRFDANKSVDYRNMKSNDDRPQHLNSKRFAFI